MPIEFNKAPGQRGQREAMMRVTMLIDWRTAVDGVHQVDYRAGQTYDVPERIASWWIEKGRAVSVGKPVPAVKMEPAAPENKMEPGPGLNKAVRARRGKTK